MDTQPEIYTPIGMHYHVCTKAAPNLLLLRPRMIRMKMETIRFRCGAAVTEIRARRQDVLRLH
jgi:hypothetical protein